MRYTNIGLNNIYEYTNLDYLHYLTYAYYVY
jgi:hypothetical protein